MAATLAVPAAPASEPDEAELSVAIAQVAKMERCLAEKAELIAEKDAQIAAVLAEGEQLSIRQMEQERSIKGLRRAARDAADAKAVKEEVPATVRAVLSVMLPVVAVILRLPPTAPSVPALMNRSPFWPVAPPYAMVKLTALVSGPL